MFQICVIYTFNHPQIHPEHNSTVWRRYCCLTKLHLIFTRAYLIKTRSESCPLHPLLRKETIGFLCMISQKANFPLLYRIEASMFTCFNLKYVF